MYYCPACNYQGYVDNEVCQICLGHGVLNNLPMECPNCAGKGCWQCQNSGKKARPIPFAMATKRIDCNELREMFTTLRIGYESDYQHIEGSMGNYPIYTESEPMRSPHALGVITVLLEMSEERSDKSMEPGEWINSVLEDSDALLLEASGLWLEKDGKAIRIYTYTS